MISCPDSIIQLIRKFDEQSDQYRSPNYNETQVRIDFINPMFATLGWDMENIAGYAEPYRDVVHEDLIRIEGSAKAPDYAFRIGGARKFFLEAKKPFVNIKNSIEPAYQLRRYAWTAKLLLSILTDFEEFAVYDTRIAPKHLDKASAARVNYITYQEYPTRWDEIASVFSKEAILKGSFDRYVESKGKRGTSEFDDQFLQEIEEWRKKLAQNLALRNDSLDQRGLNFSVQRIIDRIIFLRICEARGIETFGKLLALLNGEQLYPRLLKSFRDADDRYNSGLFHFKPDKDRHEQPDELTPTLEVDDKTLRDILRRLYYPESPYAFSAVAPDILGNVYERFLGSVIELTPAHRAKIEPKPEVRKAGGVYYTPTYIVDYIVKNTVGKLLEGKTPPEAAKLRIVDPACGSGSFLLGAYQCLLDWHHQWYLNNDPTEWLVGKNATLRPDVGGRPVLTTKERKRVLLDNIYGVDIDNQAVEVTKLSLLLKVLEGETGESVTASQRLWHDRALPDLGDNIKCGNSLVGPDIYDTETGINLSSEEKQRVNAFDWESEFRKVFRSRGFDAVIGNPPYGAEIAEPEFQYLKDKYETVRAEIDTYSIFMERAVFLAKARGLISMIVPTGWYSGPRFSSTRRLVACASDPLVFVNLPYDVFKAWVDTTVFITRKRSKRSPWPRMEPCDVGILTFPKRHRIRSAVEFETGWTSSDFISWFARGSDEFLTRADKPSSALLQKVESVSKSLRTYADVQRGVTPFDLTDSPLYPTSRRAFAGTVRRYRIDMGKKAYIRFDRTLAELKPERYFVGPRLLLRELISRQFQLQGVKVDTDFVTNKSMQSILALPGGPGLSFLLGILNSRLISWHFLHRSHVAQRDDFEVLPKNWARH
jgi:hypothetical protein